MDAASQPSESSPPVPEPMRPPPASRHVETMVSELLDRLHDLQRRLARFERQLRELPVSLAQQVPPPADAPPMPSPVTTDAQNAPPSEEGEPRPKRHRRRHRKRTRVVVDAAKHRRHTRKKWIRRMLLASYALLLVVGAVAVFWALLKWVFGSV